MTDFNNKNIGTYSQAIKKVTALKKFIIDTIDNIPEVKRLTRYNDDNPLKKRGLDYSGKIITHNDLTTTLTKDTVEGKKVLYSGIFIEETIGELGNLIYVTPKVMDVGHTVNQYLFEIDILVNQEYNDLANYGDERIYSIADYIIQALDNHTIENTEIVDKVGNVELKVMGKIIPSRLTNNSSHILLPIPIIVKSIGVRANE